MTPVKLNLTSLQTPVSGADNFAELKALLTLDRDAYWAQYGPLKLTTYLQPIFSFSHRRIIGHEGLLRAFDPDGEAVSPLTVINSTASFDEARRLDRLARLLHVCNHHLHGIENDWLFLNMHPLVFNQAKQSDSIGFLGQVLANVNYPAHGLSSNYSNKQ